MSRDDSTTRSERRVTRRAVLGVASSAAVALAGCFGGGGDSTPTSTSPETATPDPTETRTATESPTPPSPEETVRMTDDRSFDPNGLAIDPGDTVEWVNEGSLTHTVTADQSSFPEGAAYFASGGFDSESVARSDWNGGARAGAIEPGETYSHTFETRGFYRYVCIPHENSGENGMVGFVEVGNPTPTPTSGN